MFTFSCCKLWSTTGRLGRRAGGTRRTFVSLFGIFYTWDIWKERKHNTEHRSWITTKSERLSEQRESAGWLVTLSGCFMGNIWIRLMGNISRCCSGKYLQMVDGKYLRTFDGKYIRVFYGKYSNGWWEIFVDVWWEIFPDVSWSPFVVKITLRTLFLIFATLPTFR